LIEISVDELRVNKQSLINAADESLRESVQEEIDDYMLKVLYLLVISSKVSKACKSEQDEFKMCRLVYQLNKQDLRTSSGATLLHMAVDADTAVDEFRTKNICKFPCSATAKLLIKCGADVNAMNRFFDTPLHLIVLYQKPISDFLTLHAIIQSLINANAHLDYVNLKGRTPFSQATTGVAEIILRSESKISLKCLAARAIARHKISFSSHMIPHELELFVRLHGLR
jgi:Fem-1 family protein b